MQLSKVLAQLDVVFPNIDTKQYPKTLITGALNRDINKIGIALDFLSSTLMMAHQKDCDLLLVHHGPPNYEPFDSKVTQKKIRLARKLGLCVYTLPFCLDISTLGTTAGFVKLLGIKAESVPVNFQGNKVNHGVYKLASPITHEELISRLISYPSANVRIYGKTKKKYKSVAIAAGGGFQTDLMEQVIPEVYISGDLNIRAIRTAEELGILLIELSHSSMENFPLQITAKGLNKLLKVPVVYLEQKEPEITVIKQ